MRPFALAAFDVGLLFATASPAQAPSSGGGPAIWRVADADSSVFIVGIPGGLPKGMAWNSSRLEAHLQGAGTLLLPPEAKGGPAAAISFMLKLASSFRSERPMEETLPPALRTRFVAARQGLSKPADRYAKWKPGVAGMLLLGDFRRGENVAFGEPEKRIRALGRTAHVKEQRVGA